MLTAYQCLAPVGRHLSVDRLLRRRAESTLTRPSSWATVARRLLQVHLAMVYLAMALGKLGGETWWNGEALWWLAAQPDSGWADLSWLRDSPLVRNLWTHLIVASELSYPVLIWNPWLRPLVLAVSMLVWVSLGIASGHLGLCVVMMVANLAFVPSNFWRGIVPKRGGIKASTDTAFTLVCISEMNCLTNIKVKILGININEKGEE